MAVLFIPVKYAISGKKDHDSQLHVNVSWAFNLVKTDMTFKCGSKLNTDFAVAGYSVDIESGYKKEEKLSCEKEKKAGKGKKKMHIRQILSKSMFKSIRVLISDFLRLLKPEKLKLIGIIGFEDPYYTGMICSLIYGLKGQLKSSDIDVTSAFDREVFEGNFEIEGKLTVAAFMFILMKFVFSKPVRRILVYQIGK